MHADLNPDRRLHATGGQARSLYAELAKNLATRTKPEGGALPGVVEKFISQAKSEAKASGKPAEAVVREKLNHLAEMVNGYDFAEVIAAYCRGFEEGNEQLKADAVRWLRGEFTTRTDARAALGVRTIIDDASIYDQLKLLARFVRLAGYSGLMVCLDELVNLYKLSNTQARNANYEQILRILNDSLQGSAEGLGIVLAEHRSFSWTRVEASTATRPAVPVGGEHLCQGWNGGLLRSGAAPGEPYARRFLCAALEAQACLCLGG
jgi:hypothetical protein